LPGILKRFTKRTWTDKLLAKIYHWLWPICKTATQYAHSEKEQVNLV
jgi:hypothetical protein